MIPLWLRRLWSKFSDVLFFQDTVLFAFCLWALWVQTQYRVPGHFLFLLLPWVGIAITITGFLFFTIQVLKVFSAKDMLRHDLRVVRSGWELLLIAFIFYSVFLYINCGTDPTTPDDVKTVVLDTTEGELDFGAYIPYARAELRSWDNTEKVAHIYLKREEERWLWPNQAVLARIHAGTLGLRWVSEIEPDDEVLYLKVLDLAPTAAIARRELTNFYVEHKSWEKALKSAQAYLALYPNDVAAARYWSSKFGHHNDVISSIALLKPLVERRPHYDLYLDLGDYMGRLGIGEKGLAYIRKAIEMEPDNSEGYYVEGIVLSHLERVEEAIASYEKALQLNTDFVIAKEEIAILREKIRTHQPAKSPFR